MKIQLHKFPQKKSIKKFLQSGYYVLYPPKNDLRIKSVCLLFDHFDEKMYILSGIVKEIIRLNDKGEQEEYFGPNQPRGDCNTFKIVKEQKLFFLIIA